MDKIIDLTFKREINVDNVMELSRLQLDLKKSAKDDGNIVLANMYDRKARAYEEVASALITNAIMTIPDILSLPAIAVLSLPLDSTRFSLDIEETKELKIIKASAGNEVYRETVKAITKSPNTQKQVQEFKEKISNTAERLQVEGFDLFALNKENELALKLKAKYEKSLTPEQKKQLFAKEIRDTLLDCLLHGDRKSAVDLLKNYMLKYKNLSEYEIHSLLNALKDKFKIKEPKTNAYIDNLYLNNFKGQWLFITFIEAIIVGNIEKKITNGIIGLFDPDKYSDGIIGIDGKIKCTFDVVHKFRPVTLKEKQIVEEALEKLKL